MARELYGLAEIAETLGLTRQAVTVWRKRRSWGMPEPDVELASGPVWHGETIEPWLQTQRSRLTSDTKAVTLSAGDVRRAGRRMLRLLVLLLEEPHRPNLIQQALQDLGDLARHVAQAADDDQQGRVYALLAPLAGVDSIAAATAPQTRTQLAHWLIQALPDLRDILLDAIADPGDEGS